MIAFDTFCAARRLSDEDGFDEAGHDPGRRFSQATTENPRCRGRSSGIAGRAWEVSLRGEIGNARGGCESWSNARPMVRER